MSLTCWSPGRLGQETQGTSVSAATEWAGAPHVRGCPRPACHYRHPRPTGGSRFVRCLILCEAKGGLGGGGQITATIPYSSAQSHPLIQPIPYRVTREGHTQHVRPTGEWTPRAGPGCSDQAQAWTANYGLLSSHALLNEVHQPWPMSLTPRNLEGGTDQRPSPRKHCPLNALYIPFRSKHRVL